MKNEIVLAAGAEASDLTKIKGIAYGGGAVTQFWANKPIYIDLSGMQVAPQVPLMYNHVNEPECRIGEVTAMPTAETLEVVGGIDAHTERGREIADAGRRIKWQLSIGAQVLRSEDLAETAEINGRKVNPPAIIVRESLLREVSVVAIGADSATEMAIVAKWNSNNKLTAKEGEKNMAEEEKKDQCEGETPDTEEKEKEVDAEGNAAEKENKEKDMEKEVKQRIDAADIVAILGDAPKDVVVKAIRQGWTADMAKAVADSVKAVTASKPAAANIVVKEDGLDAQAIEAALSIRAGFSLDETAKQYGDKATDRASRMRNMSLRDTLRECLKLSGHFAGGYIGHEEIQAGFQTTDLPRLLGNVAHKAMLKAYMAQQIAATTLCSEGDIADYKEATRIRIADLGPMQEVPEGGEVTDTAIGEEYAVNQIKRYAQIFWLDEKLIINDDLGGFTRLPALMGARAADYLDDLFFERLTANANFTDGKALFSTDHKNLVTGATSALSLESLKKAYTQFRKQTDKGGQPISVTPRYLLVPAELEPEALEITTSQTVVGGTTRSASVNVISKWGLQVVSSPKLDAVSSKAWYLFGDPALCDTFEIAYLRGQRVPTIEQGRYDLNRFGVCYRVRFDFGVQPMDFRSIYKAKGEA